MYKQENALNVTDKINKPLVRMRFYSPLHLASLKHGTYELNECDPHIIRSSTFIFNGVSFIVIYALTF